LVPALWLGVAAEADDVVSDFFDDFSTVSDETVVDVLSRAGSSAASA
jgi:predicted phosphoribosyltransferase